MPPEDTWLDLLLQEAPFPVAHSLCMVVEARDGDPSRRVLALIDTTETLIRWAAAMALATYQNDGFFDRKTNAQISEMIGRKLTTGSWLSILRSTMAAYPRTRRVLRPEALAAAWFEGGERHGRAARILDELIALRNQVVHGGYREAKEIEVLATSMNDGVESLLRSWTHLLCSYRPVTVEVREGEVARCVPMSGAASDFFPRVRQPAGCGNLGDGRHTVLVGPDGRSLFGMEPFCTRTRDGQCALLSSLADDSRLPGGHRLCMRTFAPSEDRWLKTEDLEPLPNLCSAAAATHDALESLVRRVPEQDLARTIAVRLFPSLLHEVVSRRRLFIGREREVMFLREWAENLTRARTGSRLLLVRGRPGMGKTSLLVNYALDFDSVWHVAATGDRRDGTAPIITSLLAQIGAQFEIEGTNVEENCSCDTADLASRLASALEIASARILSEDLSPLVMVVDNLEGFRDRGAEFLASLPAPLPAGTGLVLSCRAVPPTPRFPSPTMLDLGPLDAPSIAQMSRSLGYKSGEEDMNAMAATLHEVTGGCPLFLRMILGDHSLLECRDGIRGPDDVIRLLLERYDGRRDEDAYESVLALLSISSRPLSTQEVADILDLKPRKVRAFFKGISPYLRMEQEAAAFSAPQLAEYLTGRLGQERIDPTILSVTIRRFIDYLRRMDREEFVRYRRVWLPVLMSQLPEPEPKEELERWMQSSDFAAKVAETIEDCSPHLDVALYLEHGGSPEVAIDVLRTLLRAPEDHLVIGTLLTLRALPILSLEAFAPDLEWLEGSTSRWISKSLCRLYRAQLRHKGPRAGQPTLMAMDLLPHLPFLAPLVAAGDSVRLVLSESWCERLEIVRLQRPEFIATTLDEVAALSREGFGYLPFYRLLDSQGLDAVVVGSGVDATGLEELHGRKVGYEAGSISQLWFAQLLDDAGCGYGHVEHKPFVSIEDAAHALHDGRIDAAVLWSPWIEASGGRVLVASGDPGQVINDVLCVREDLDPALASIAAAITAAFDAFARGHREYDARTARRFLGLCPDEISQQLAGVRFLSWAQSRVLFEEGATRKGGVQWTAERICELLGMDTRFLCLARSRAWVASVSAALRVHEC